MQTDRQTDVQTAYPPLLHMLSGVHVRYYHCSTVITRRHHGLDVAVEGHGATAMMTMYYNTIIYNM